MPKSDGHSKADKLYLLCKLFEPTGRKLRTGEIAEKLGVDDDTVRHYIKELDSTGRLPLRKDGQYWVLAEYAHIERLKVHLTVPEATAFYVAARLLSQIHDERNRHVMLALNKLVEAMPESLRSHQYALIEMAEQRQQDQEDRSTIFEALAMGWALHRKVRMVYEPTQKRPFECLFSPYLLEPSGIGRTIYAIGHSTPPDKIRTRKLERIKYATLTDEPFTIPEDFDGPRLLKTAWGVMYNDEESILVRVRFSENVEKRVQETLWHPSQTLTHTSDGCEWTAMIGDTLEIENWLRGWGADCEVLAPENLRQKIIENVRRLANMYEVLDKQSVDMPEQNNDLFNKFFGA